MNKRKKVNKIPKDFKSYDEAAEFWDSHDSADFDDLLEKVDINVDIQKRHYLVELNKDIAEMLKSNAQKKGILPSKLASEILEKQLVGMK